VDRSSIVGIVAVCVLIVANGFFVAIVLGDYQLRVEELDHRRIARLRMERK
jgi:hypothetical protein